MDNNYFVNESVGVKPYPWYFSTPWIIANIFIGSILSIIFFYIGRRKFKNNQPNQTFMMLGFVFMILAWIINIYIFI